MAPNAFSISNYYYPAYCMGDGATAWSSNDAVTYVGNYNGQIATPEAAAAYSIDGMYSAVTAYAAPYTQQAAPATTPFNYFPGTTSEYPPSWNASASMPPVTAKPYEDYYREGMYDGMDTLKNIDHRLQSLDIAADANSNKMSDPRYCYGVQRTDMYMNSSSTTTTAAEKKTTWASIAKQPAKPIPQTSSSGSKKKGPGMPPPPMVPGRHIDLNTWEPKTNSVPKAPVVQAPPPPASVNSMSKPVWNGPVLTTDMSSEINSHHFEPGNTTVSVPPSMQSSHSSSVLATVPASLPSPARTQSNAFTNQTATNRPPPSSGAAVVAQSSASLSTVCQQPPSVSATVRSSVQTSSSSATSSAVAASLASVPTTSPEVFVSTSSLSSTSSTGSPPPSVVDKLRDKNNYNPSELELPPKGTRFFVIKSYSEDDVHRSIKYEIWCSTEHGNKRLDEAFNDQKSVNGAVYLFFSVNGSGHFCGMARMISPVDYNASSSVWAQDKWKGQFKVRWIYVKDVPNSQLRHIRLENNENKPVTNSRDTQEVPYDKGVNVLKIIHGYSHTTSIFDDFTHYEKRQEEGDNHKRGPPPSMHQGHSMQYQNHSTQRSNPFGGRSMHNKVSADLKASNLTIKTLFL